MGAGASVANPPVRKGPQRDHSNDVSSRTARSVNSVRAMALKNHARQENSYIPSDRLRSRFNKTARHANAAEFVDDGNMSHDSATILEEAPRAQRAADPEPSTLTAAPSGNLMQFKSAMNLNLKLNLEDDNDWGKVQLPHAHCLFPLIAISH
jgi:hypothetical protein